MPTLDSRLMCLANLPSMPLLLTEALHQLDGSQDSAALADKIGLDPAVAARILRVVNSPFYGMPREIGSLREAVVLLGFNRIRNLLISVCFTKLSPTQHKDFDYRRFWHHSMAVAECSRLLAGCTAMSVDLAFAAGLLHDIGQPIIALLFPDEFSRIAQAPGPNLAETERRLLGFDHMSIGNKAASCWNFPAAIQQGIAHHETAPRAMDSKSLGLLIYTANALINKLEQCDSIAFDEYDGISPVLSALDISTERARHCADSGQQFAGQFVALI